MKYFPLALLAGLCLLTAGCTAAKHTAATTEASTEWRIKSLEESFLNFREEQRQQADQSVEAARAMDTRLAAIEAELATLKGGAVIVDAPDDMTTEQAWSASELKPEDKGWVEGTPAEGGVPVAESSEDKPWAEVPGPPPAVIPEPTVGERPEAVQTGKAGSAKKTAAAKAVPAGAQSMYDTGLAKYNADDFDGSRGAFDEFLKKYPKDGLVPNALYWKGETYYSQKDYAQAIMAFKEVTGRFPKHDKAASALLKIGMSYDRVGDPDNAVFYLRALVEDFPKSDPAALARKELSRLGG
jgi:tol-pal system protein YbgF